MRKLLFLVIFLCLIPITACQKASKATNSLENETIVRANLTSREEQLIKATGVDSYYVFDAITKNPNIKTLECWADYYENGKFKTKIGGITSSINVSKDTLTSILFSTQVSKSNSVEEKWTFSIISKSKSGYSCSTATAMVTKVKSGSGSMNGGTEKNKILMDEPIILAVYVASEKSPIAISNGIFYNTKDLDQVLGNDYVYVLRGKFNT